MFPNATTTNNTAFTTGQIKFDIYCVSVCENSISIFPSNNVYVSLRFRSDK